MKKTVKRHIVVQPEDESIRLIALSRGMNAIVDSDMFEELDAFNWSVHNSPTPGHYYAARCREGKTFFLHHAVMPATEGMVVDHINGDGLDNRISNLRLCKQHENVKNAKRKSTNTSGYKGVYWSPLHRKWRSSIQNSGHRHHLGLFDSAEDAHMAYKKASEKLHQEFGRAA